MMQAHASGGLPLVLLQRLAGDEQGTPGLLSAPGFYCRTMELPWRDNARRVSRIPPGNYLCSWHQSPRFGGCYLLHNVPGRSHVLIHRGNLAGDEAQGWRTHSHGCILLGARAGALELPDGRAQRAVLVSRPTVRQFHQAMGRESFTLEIREP